MAKSKERLIARSLRKQGLSVKDIAKQLEVAKSTVSLWVRDIILSIDQLEKLRQKMITSSERGRLLGSLKQKNERLKRIKISTIKGIELMSKLNKRELLIAGTSLYWADGTKKKRGVSFCNSDPKLIQFMINWLKECFNVSNDQIRCNVGINEIHKNREKIVKDYWSDITNIPVSQFTKTSFKKVKNKKIYDNFNQHYGTLVIKVTKSAKLYYDILGLIEGLRQHKSQGSSVVVAHAS